MVINRKETLSLLALPIALMGFVQLTFAFLSLSIFHDHEEVFFLGPALTMIIVATLLFSQSHKYDFSKINSRDSLIFAALTWISIGLLGAVPIILIAGTSITDGIFESISAVTTTGATMLSGLDQLPKSFLLYRQFLQWLGGLGVVIFVVAVLPMLNVGGMKLLKAETVGPVKNEKLSPRIASTAHYLWMVYVVITALCALGYYLGGMSSFDALGHSFSTVSTGGFSTHDASMGYFGSGTLLLISDIFMLLGAISFALHFKMARARTFAMYWQDEETRIFILLILGIALFVTVIIAHSSGAPTLLSAINYALFHVISFITSTGFGATGFNDWPIAATLLLVFAGYMGGCAGSTAGGNKIIRNILSFKVIIHELKRLVNPKGVFAIKYQGQAVESSVLQATMAFMTIVAFTSFAFTLALMATGLDFWEAFTAVAACLNVLGPAFGALGSNFQPVSDAGTWLLSGAMILGRLEYFTLLALLLPGFWRS